MMAPNFVACRICRSVEGKLKNYTDNAFLIKVYEEFSGCPFAEWPYMTKFCPKCACLLRKVYKFRKICRRSYTDVVQYLENGRKITKQFIQQKGTGSNNISDLSTWKSDQIPTIDYVHNPKASKGKKKGVDEMVFYMKHFTVPNDPVAEPESTYHSNDHSSDIEEPQLKKSNVINTINIENQNLDALNVFETPLVEPSFEASPVDVPNFEASPVDVPNFEASPVERDLEDFDKGNSILETSVLCKEFANEDIDVKIEDDMIGNVSDDHIEDSSHFEDSEKELKIEPDLDPDNLTLQEIKAGMMTGMKERDDGKKRDKRKKNGKGKEKECQVSQKSQQLQKRARRHQSNQELEEQFTITQFLTEDEQVEEFLKRKQGEGYLEGKYKCELCLKSFKEQKWMDAHTQKHEPSAGSYVCTICKIRSRTPKLYRTHRDSNHTTRYACRRCHYFTYSKAQALKHHGWHEGVEHTCQHCGATFRKHTTYMGHLRRAHPSAHICGACARSFVSAYGLNLHVKHVHKDINKLEHDSPRCDDCDVTFVSRQMYVRHLLITERHKDISNDIINKLEHDSTRCDECDVTFVSRQMYVRHLLITERHKGISNDILGCRKCGEQFETKEEMEKHTHYKERKYVRKDAPRRSIKCDECGEVFSHPNGVYQHYLREHPDTPYRFAVRRHYLCEQCGKTFKSPGLLQQHALTHLGLRPPAAKKPAGRNACRLCGKTYSKLSGLFRHKLTHLGVRRHKCHICEKAFTDTSNLKQHVQGVHLNIRRIRKR